MKVTFAEKALDEYMEWQFEDKKTLKRINQLLQDIQRNGLSQGIGKPELLKGYSKDVYSRHIDEFNRLIYTSENGNVEIFSCKGHYQDK